MENIDFLVLRTLRDWRASGRHALLATVVQTWGSSPRPVGSIMSLREDGAVVGSVSGGCIEDDLIRRYRERRGAGGPPELVKYGLSADEAHRFGLPCGGTLELVLEYDPPTISLAPLVAELEAGGLMNRELQLADGAASLAPTDVPQELLLDGARLRNTFGPRYRMLLIGAGQLAEYLATMALFSGFDVTVCDPREEHSAVWSVQHAKLVRSMPDDAVMEFNPDARSCVIALTHDPKLDDLALIEALATSAFYVGAIGSRRNTAARRARLREHFEIDDGQLAMLRGPVGIYIGSKTPSEIAISVMAEVIAAKNGVLLPTAFSIAQAKVANERIAA